MRPLLIVISGVCLLAFLIVSCADNGAGSSVTSATPDTQGFGAMSLVFEKAAVPATVDSVFALLTRTGFSPIAGALSIVTDTSAAITIEGVAAGVWHLRVEAKDTAGTVRFAGDADISVLADRENEVDLQLVPTDSTTGTVHIVAQWGTNPANPNQWTLYSGNPVLTHIPGFTERFGIIHGKVLQDGETYKIWFSSVSDTDCYFANYATSADGKHWTRYGSNPIISPTSGTPDAGGVEVGSVIKTGSGFRMFYEGFIRNPVTWTALTAVSADGITWEKSPGTILSPGSAESWDGDDVSVSDVVKCGEVYYLYFTGRGPAAAIGVATSSDGVTWTKYSGNPILVADESWESGGVCWAEVVAGPGGLEMIYMNVTGTAFGAASSADGLHWVKTRGGPELSTTDVPGAQQIAYPSIMKKGTATYLYFAALLAGSSPSGMAWEWCLATKGESSVTSVQH